MANVALIELGDGHGECLYSQVRFLRESGHHVVVLIHPEQRDRTVHFGVPVETLPISGSSFRGSWQVIRALRQHLAQHRISTVVFNTASGALFRNVVLTLPRSLPAFAIIHDVNKLADSWRQRFVARRMTGLLVLAERLIAPCQAVTGVPTSSFYPAWFPPTTQAESISVVPISKSPGDLWLISIGQIETKRRNYATLLHAADTGWPDSVRVLLLGKPIGADGEAVVQRLRTSRMAPRITMIDRFVPDEDLHRIVLQCDGILPLTDERARYRHQAVSGAFNLAYGYQLPLITGTSADADTPEIFDVTLSPRPGQHLADLLTQLGHDPGLLHTLREHMRSDPRWNFSTSQARYLSALGFAVQRAT